MRRIAHYKRFTKKLPLIRSLLAPRVLRFKRTKWLGVKKILLSSRPQKQIQSPLSIKVEYKYWNRIRSQYKGGLLSYSALNLFFEHVYSKRRYKRSISGLKKLNDIFRSLFLAPFFRVDVLLWKLQFFKSSYAARQSLIAREILVNGQIPSTLRLKRGDVIELKRINFSQRAALQKFAFIFLYSVVEVDYYSCTVVVLKDIKETSFLDFILLLREPFAFRRIINYIRR
jgi:ribosomal protein S4